MEQPTVQQGEHDSADVLKRYKAELPLIELIARQLLRSIGSSVDYEDLCGAGREGLFDAARKYDSSGRVPFQAYASLRVRGAMLDGIRRQSYLPRRAHERFLAVDAALAGAEAEVNHAYSPTLGRLSTGEAERRMGAHLASVATATALSSAPHGEESGGIPASDYAPDPEEQLARAELMELVRRTMDEMTPDEAGVIRAYYFEGRSMNDVAEQENLSKSWVNRLHSQAMGRLTQRMKASD